MNEHSATIAVDHSALPLPPAFMAGATSLPAHSYTDPDIHSREMAGAFRDGWVSVASVGQVPDPGDLLAVELLGEPLLVTRDRLGAVHVFYNICRHRGVKLVQDGAARCGTGIINCPYHMWGYGLDGALKATPYWGGTAGSGPAEKADLGLVPVRAATWCGMVFVNLSGSAEPFEQFVAPLAERWQAYDFALLRQATSGEWTIPTNWKFAVENFLDLYHLPWVHPELGTAAQVFADVVHNYLSDRIFGYIMPHFDRPRDEMPVKPDMFPALPEMFDYALDLMYVFPNTLILAAPSWVQVISLLPDGAGTTHERLFGFVVGDAMMGEVGAHFREELAGLLAAVNEQDIAILTALQKGRATAATDAGHYAPYWDQLGEYFANTVRAIAAIGDPPR